MTDHQKFPNTYRQPQDYDTILDVEYIPGDGVLVVHECPPGVLVTGTFFQCKVGHTLYLVTSLGAGDINWTIPGGPVEGTVDDTYPVGTGVVLELTRAGVESLRQPTYLTSADESGNGFPNSRKPRLTDDTDVLLASPANNDVLTYETSTSKWKNKPNTGGGGSGSLAGDSDVQLTSPADGEILEYDGSISKWINAVPTPGSGTLAGDTDVQLTSPADGDLLEYDAGLGKWRNVSAHVSGAGLEVVTTPLPVIRSGEMIVSGLLNTSIVIVPGGQAPPDFLTTEDGTDFVYEDVVFPPEPVTTPDNMNWIYG